MKLSHLLLLSFVLRTLALVGVEYYRTMTPSEAEARAALVAKHPDLADKPMWFDGRIVAEEGFAVDLEKRQYRYYTSVRDMLMDQYWGEFQWGVANGWHTANEFTWAACTKRGHDPSGVPCPAENPSTNTEPETIPAPRLVQE